MSTPVVRHPGEFRWETRLLGVTTLVLTVLGIASCYSSGIYLAKWYQEATEQGIAALVGIVVFLVAARIDYRVWRKVALPLIGVTIAGLVMIAVVAVLYKGRKAPGKLGEFIPYLNGSHRWIKVGAQVQMAEIARFTLALWLATYAAALGKKVRDFREGFVPLICVIGVVCGLIAVEPSVTMAAVLGVIGIATIFTAGVRVPHLVPVVVVAAVAIVLVLKLDSTRKNRNEEFKGHAIECVPGVQACDGLIGFGSGGLQGVGFGNGMQKMGHTPEVFSDFLLSVIGEEWGFIGVCFVGLCFVVFCWLGFRIANTAPDPFGTYLAAGLTVSIGVTAFMHAAVVTWLMPATGVTLPFMSAGRISLLLNILSAGVLVSIGRQRGKPARSK